MLVLEVPPLKNGELSLRRQPPTSPTPRSGLIKMTTFKWFHDNSSTDISSTTLRLQTFRLQTFRILLYTSVQDSYMSNFCFSKSLFSSIPTSTYIMIPFYQSHFH